VIVLHAKKHVPDADRRQAADSKRVIPQRFECHEMTQIESITPVHRWMAPAWRKLLQRF
jgi:hypothetical protein